jgi:hypothetical protein
MKRTYIVGNGLIHYLSELVQKDIDEIREPNITSDSHIVDALKGCKSNCVIYIADKDFETIKKRLPEKLKANNSVHIDTSRVSLGEMSSLFTNPKSLTTN